jgi:C-terminal processing protease CtpA/Prc
MESPGWSGSRATSGSSFFVRSRSPGGGAAIAVAMELVSGTDALVLDLRRNRGGSPQGVAMKCSYFFADDGTHLSDIYDALEGTTRQFWTWGWVPGERHLKRPVWVLVSGDIFSGGEELAYNVKVQRRYKLVGATTRGGAHPTRRLPLSATLEISIPAARSINLVTGSNGEGIGVEPDEVVDPGQALDVALVAAARYVAADVPGTSAGDEARALLAHPDCGRGRHLSELVSATAHSVVSPE